MNLKSWLIVEQSKTLDYLKVKNDIKTGVNPDEVKQLQKEGKLILKKGLVFDDFYRYIRKSDFDEESLSKAVMLKQFHDIKVIKYCMLFFTVITAISMLVSLIMGISFFNTLSNISF